jgi:hypothetical protein
MSKIWDLNLARYHKFYYQANTDRSFKQGDKLDFSVIVQIVPHEGGDWVATKVAAETLKKAYPPQK